MGERLQGMGGYWNKYGNSTSGKNWVIGTNM